MPFAIIGVNSDYEGNLEKINKMLDEQGITWRQAIDGTTSGPIAKRWNVQGWPTIYVLDAKGVIRHQQFGEGAYEKAERTIQRLLAKAGTHSLADDLVIVDGQGIEAAADWTVAEQRLHQLIRQPVPIVDRQFEIEFLDPSVEVFAFTFG